MEYYDELELDRIFNILEKKEKKKKEIITIINNEKYSKKKRKKDFEIEVKNNNELNKGNKGNI